MAALVKKRRRLYAGRAQELSEDFKKEISDMMKQVAHEHNCNVEDLKFSVNSLGVVNIRSLTVEEIIERDKNA